MLDTIVPRPSPQVHRTGHGRRGSRRGRRACGDGGGLPGRERRFDPAWSSQPGWQQPVSRCVSRSPRGRAPGRRGAVRRSPPGSRLRPDGARTQSPAPRSMRSPVQPSRGGADRRGPDPKRAPWRSTPPPLGRHTPCRHRLWWSLHKGRLLRHRRCCSTANRRRRDFNLVPHRRPILPCEITAP